MTQPRRLNAAVKQIADALGQPVLIGDLSGRVLHETPSLHSLLGSDPEAERIRSALQALLRPELYSDAPVAAEGDSAPPIWREVRTRNGRYILLASLRPLPGRRSPVVLVFVQPGDKQRISEEELRGTFSLTRTEARVALLLGQGMSNTGVAQVLTISPHTARRHTERVLFKLGVRSRAEVAAQLFSRDDLRPGKR